MFAFPLDPLSIGTPVPGDLGLALDQEAFAPDSDFRVFREGGMSGLRSLAGLEAPIARGRYSHTPASICFAVGTIGAYLTSALISSLNIGDPACASQFIHGFPITGFLIQSGVFA